MLTREDTVLVGHPFAPIGRGEDIRCTFRALQAVHATPRVLDLYGLNRPDGYLQRQIKTHLTDSLGAINLFHLNGNEIEQALAHLQVDSIREQRIDIAYPQWELAHYPLAWVEQLDRFDEIWAPTRFVFDALRPVVKKPLRHVPLACQVELSSLLGRRYFGLPETTYTFLFFFDFRSYVQRKNPEAVLDSFEKLLAKHPGAATTLVLKLNGAEQAPAEVARLQERIKSFDGNVQLIDRTMTDNEVKNLVRCCDCFISLHRSEGFGRGLAEAMFLGKPVIATAYSGNMDFMDDQNSLLVDYALVALQDGDYPHWQGQQWADADHDQASHYMSQLVSRPSLGYELGRRAAHSILQSTGFRRSGIHYAEEIARLARSGETRRNTATSTIISESEK